MSANSSPVSNSSLSLSCPFSTISLHFYLHRCLKSTFGTFNITTFTITIALVILPLCIFILYLGFQRWRQQRSGTTMSHTDVFTYHMAVLELMSDLGFIIICCGVHTDLPHVTMVGNCISSFNMTGQILFHLLTCVERYLAVIHPIAYLSLRKEKWIRLRNIIIGCVWLLCFAGADIVTTGNHLSMAISTICIIAFILVVISFCSLSVLCVLNHPGPGEGGGNRQSVDQLKLRAFYTIMAILGVLLLKFLGGILITVLFALHGRLRETAGCDVWFITLWFGLPSSLVLPLLFLQRTGKLMCCKTSNASGQGSD